MQRRYITRHHRHTQLAVVVNHLKIRNNSRGVVLYGRRGESIRRTLIQMGDLIHRRAKLFFCHTQGLLHLLIMTLGELTIVFAQYLLCQLHRFDLLLVLQLRQQTFLHIRTRYSGRIKRLDLRYNSRHLFIRHNQTLLKSQIIHQLLRRPAQIAVLVNITQYPLGYMPLRLGHLGQINLRFQIVNQTFTAIRNLTRTATFIAATLTAMRHNRLIIIVRRTVVAHVLLYVAIAVVITIIALIKRIIFHLLQLIRIHTFFQHRILLQLFVDTLLQIHCRQFQHTYQLYLRRRQLGLQFLLLYKTKRGHGM